MSKDGYDQTVEFVERMLNKVTKKQMPSFKERLISRGQKPYEKSNVNDLTICDYINHASHTEVQLYVVLKAILASKFKINDNFIASTKLPCWSCIKLPYLKGKTFCAWEFGLFDEELKLYPNHITYPDDALKPSRVAKEKQTKVNLKLVYSSDRQDYLQSQAKDKLNSHRKKDRGIRPKYMKNHFSSEYDDTSEDDDSSLEVDDIISENEKYMWKDDNESR